MKRNAPAIAPSPDTPPLAIRRRPLDTITAVRKQAANLYWDARRNRITAQEASRMANVLAIIHRMLVDGALELRLNALESRLDAAPARTAAAPGDTDDHDDDED